MSWSKQFCDLFGINSHDVPGGLDEFLRFVHPNDHEKVRQNLASAASGNTFDSQIRLLTASRGMVRIFCRGVPIADRSGEIVSVIGLCRETTSLQTAGPWSTSEDLLLAQAEEVANFGSWEFDLGTRKATVSTHLAHMLGLQQGSQVDEYQYWAMVHPEDRPHVRGIVETAIENAGPFQYTTRYFLNGHVMHHFVRGLTILDQNGHPEKMIGVLLDISDQTYTESELHRLSQQLIRARDEERRKIARDLHESAGQTLAALKMSLGRLGEALPDDGEQVRGLLSSSIDLAEDAIREIRTISYLMHPPMLDEAGLSSALRWYAKGFGERSGIAIQLEIPEDFGRHSREVETTIFRIVQEALTNVHRYSGSRTASIRLGRQDGIISAEIVDHGCGLQTPSSTTGWSVPLGVGIVGMRERVKQLNGSFEMESAPGKGTTVRVLLPVDSAEFDARLRRQVEVSRKSED